MSLIDTFEKAAKQPDLRLAGLKIWIHGFQFPGVAGVDDREWLEITARCSAPGASVWFRGPYLQRSDLQFLHDGVRELDRTLSGSAALDCVEPYLALRLEALDRLGHIRLTVHITPDHASQEHRFDFEFDQSFLAGFARDCDAALNLYVFAHDQKA
jgi:hypothetical protein